jgi:hypothetical protein
MRWRSPSELRHLVNVDGQAVAVHRDDDPEKATSARLPAFSISSRQSSTTRGLRREITPATPIAKMNADRTRYQVMSTG